ncbi:MAG: hypothetical protein ABIP89_02415, partial [Polyangiaceae bacterium]
CAAASKEECIDAHSRGQDLREKGQLTRARQMFMACAQNSCPGLIQADCARYGDDLDRTVPSVSFGARDSSSADLPNTTVYVDDQLLAMRLDDGKSYDLDPGKHTVRFVHDGKETTMSIVLNQGEKGRSLVATFQDLGVSRGTSDFHADLAKPKKPTLPLVVAGLGAAAILTGGVLFAVGMHQVPDSCSVSAKECTAPPGDAAFNDAHRGVSMANLGVAVGVGGVAMLAGGLIWYAVQPAKNPTESAAAKLVHPWIGRQAGGVALGSSF